jgi:oligopeptide/dipeptide ABC transporter ATP-binding protein
MTAGEAKHGPAVMGSRLRKDGEMDGTDERGVFVQDLTVAYKTPLGMLRALRDVSFELPAGGTLGIVGETGSGKSSMVNAIMRLLPGSAQIAASEMQVAGQNVLSLSRRGLRRLHGQTIGFVPQQPMAAFNPTMMIGRQVAEVLVIHGETSYRRCRPQVLDALRSVGLTDAERVADAYPHQLSGGMLQRAMIAGAIIGEPRVLVADEPTSALDVNLRSQILDLLARIRDERGLTTILISHDLTAVSAIAEQVLVLYSGRKVEMGWTEQVLSAPRHPYTNGLISSRPDATLPHKSRLAMLPGAPLSAAEVDAEQGCPFRTRCARAIDVCADTFPAVQGDGEHTFHCHNPEPGA